MLSPELNFTVRVADLPAGIGAVLAPATPTLKSRAIDPLLSTVNTTVPTGTVAGTSSSVVLVMVTRTVVGLAWACASAAGAAVAITPVAQMPRRIPRQAVAIRMSSPGY